MAIGPVVRRAFGPYEPAVSAAWRAMFIDLATFVARVRRWRPQADSILEVGCGEGAVTSLLSAAYPAGRITAIDITPRLGRLYDGPRTVRFAQCTVQDLAQREAGQFDLVILCDVLHHVPAALRADLLHAIRATLAPHGAFVFKDWIRSATPIHWLCHGSDRFITGDRVSYLNLAEMHDLLRDVFGREAIRDEARIGPWRNNYAGLIRP